MDCVLCEEPVTNPLCQDCLAKAIEQWLWEVDPTRIADLHQETNVIRAVEEDGVRCIKCKHEFRVCTFCYTKHIFNWLHDAKLQAEFVEFFNFDLYRVTPYS